MKRFTLLVTRGKPAFEFFDTLGELAIGVYRLRWTDEADKIAAGALPSSILLLERDGHYHLRPFNVEAFDGMSVLDIGLLYRHGKNLVAARQKSGWRAHLPWNGVGPVPGTGRRIRYGRKYLRRPATQRDRREARPAVPGEPMARPSRNEHYLPSTWDDIYRHAERSWKAQSKNEKSWGSRANVAQLF